MPFHGYQGRTQWAVYWERVGTDRTGQPTTSDVARELLVRWDGSTRNIPGPDGFPIAVDATVGGFAFVPTVGSLMWAGRLDDLPGTSQIPDRDVMRVIRVDVTPDVRGRSEYREAVLQRHKDSL